MLAPLNMLAAPLQPRRLGWPTFAIRSLVGNCRLDLLGLVFVGINTFLLLINLLAYVLVKLPLGALHMSSLISIHLQPLQFLV